MIDHLGQQFKWQFALPSNARGPKSGQLHIWCLPLSLNKQQTELAITRLNDHQRDKYQRRRTAQLKKTYLAGRYYLFELLAAYTQQAADDIRLAYTRLNKPYLVSHINDERAGQLHFNYTDSLGHSGALGLYAFARGSEVGVDIEALSRTGDFSRVAHRKFSREERNWAFDNQGTLQNDRFLALWTRKEAYGKAIGKGVNYVMRDRNLLSPGHHQLKFQQQGLTFCLQQFLVDDTHIACAVHSGKSALQIRAFSTLPGLIKAS